MKWKAAMCSGKGSRPYNEDTVFCSTYDKGMIAVVADGLGGHGGGEIASRVAVETLTKAYLNDQQISKEKLEKLVQQANQAVLSKQTASMKMKTTLVALFCSENQAAAVHVGDSRLYQFRNGRLIFRTKDHSVSQMAAFAGEISEKEIRFHEDRNRVLRALGGGKEVRPDIRQVAPISKSDAFLLCTDGFWEYVWEDEMQVDLLKSSTPKIWLSYLLARIGKRMNGENDNLSAVAVFCQNGREGEEQE